MILLHDVVQIFGLADDDRRAVFLIIALDRRFVGRTAIDRDLLWHTTVAPNRLVEKLPRRFLIALLREQKINGLAELVDSPVEVVKLSERIAPPAGLQNRA